VEALSSSFHPGQVVFADTSALFALAIARDQHHSQAKRISIELIATGAQTVTSNFVVAEFHALIVNRVGSIAANEALRRLENSETRVVRVEADDERRAREILDRFPGNGYTLTDVTCFAIMERLRITSAFTFDNHFALQGYDIPM
jgi:predicted nucleic acid-binding protein